MDRSEFIKQVFRYILFGVLAVIAAVAGSKVAEGASCTTCPGKGICKGENDCSKFLLVDNGK